MCIGFGCQGVVRLTAETVDWKTMLTFVPSNGQTPAVITAHGHVSLSDVKATTRLLALNHRDSGVLWDMRQSDLSELHCRDIQEVVECISSVLPKGNNYRVAIVGSNSLHFGLFRAFQTYVEFAGLTREYGYFADHSEGTNWVEPQVIRPFSETPPSAHHSTTLSP